MIPQQCGRRRTLHIVLLVLVLALGITARIYRSSSCLGIGFDEKFYRHYVKELNGYGLAGYPKIVSDYIGHQRQLGYSVLPPMRFLFIFVSHIWSKVAGAEALDSLNCVACLFTILTLFVSYFFIRKMAGKWTALGVLALMCCAPTQIHMSQHPLVDGFFTFWAMLSLWLLWENLSRPDRIGWLLAFALALTGMVITKENAFFAYMAMVAIVIANRWLAFGKVTPRLLAAMFLGPLLGVVILVCLAGGIPQIVETYKLSVSKNYTLAFAIKTGDGPWHRYLSDLLIVNPVVLLLAIGQLFRLKKNNKSEWFFTIFIAASYAIMCNIKYGMNLRYGNMWDLPLRYLAFGQLAALSDFFGRRRTLVLCILVAGLCLFELHQYWIFFVHSDVYELVPDYLLRAVKIIQ